MILAPITSQSSADAETSATPPEPPGQTSFHVFFFQVFQELPLFNFQQGDLSLYRATGRQLQTELLAQENIATQEVAITKRK